MNQTKNSLSKNFINGKRKQEELFYLGFEDTVGNFQFESAYKLQDLEQGKEVHQLICLNSFYRKQRSCNTLHTFYNLQLDIDGEREPFPLTDLDVLEVWREIGFTKPPSEIIRTSLGHFHLICKLKPLRAFPDKVNYWKHCQKGLCGLFKELGADSQPPTGFIRIPGHRNGKHPQKPLVESVFQSDSIFTLSEIHEILKQNGVEKRDRFSTVDDQINSILVSGVPCGKRNQACFTLSIYFNQNQGLNREEALERVLEWNAKLVEPLMRGEVEKCVRSAYKGNYSISFNKLNYLTENLLPAEIQRSYDRRKPINTPIRIPLTTHAQMIQAYILSNGGTLETPQRKLSKELNIPWRSFLEALKLIPDLHISTIGKGRNARSKLEIFQARRLELVQ